MYAVLCTYADREMGSVHTYGSKVMYQQSPVRVARKLYGLVY